MKDGSNNTLYFIVGGLVVLAAVIAYFMFAQADEPDLEIQLGDERITVDTD